MAQPTRCARRSGRPMVYEPALSRDAYTQGDQTLLMPGTRSCRRRPLRHPTPMPCFRDAAKTLVGPGILRAARGPTRCPAATGKSALSALEFRRLVAIVPPSVGGAACVARFCRRPAEHVPIGEPMRGLVPVRNPIAARADHPVEHAT